MGLQPLRSWIFYGDKVLLGIESFSKPLEILVVDRSGIKNLYTSPTKLDLDIRENWTVSSDDARIHMFIVKGRYWGWWCICYS